MVVKEKTINFISSILDFLVYRNATAVSRETEQFSDQPWPAKKQQALGGTDRQPKKSSKVRQKIRSSL